MAKYKDINDWIDNTVLPYWTDKITNGTCNNKPQIISQITQSLNDLKSKYESYYNGFDRSLFRQNLRGAYVYIEMKYGRELTDTNITIGDVDVDMTTNLMAFEDISFDYANFFQVNMATSGTGGTTTTQCIMENQQEYDDMITYIEGGVGRDSDFLKSITSNIVAAEDDYIDYVLYTNGINYESHEIDRIQYLKDYTHYEEVTSYFNITIPGLMNA
jgi:hypothetical protein